MGALSATAAAAVVAAAAVDENDGKNDQPNPVVLKQIAKTVVHNIPPRNEIAIRRRSVLRFSIALYVERSGVCRNFVARRRQNSSIRLWRVILQAVIFGLRPSYIRYASLVGE